MLQRLRERERRYGKKLASLARLSALDLFYSEEEEQGRARAVDDAAAAFGLRAVRAASTAEPPVVYLWPENVAVWELFQAVRTQWNVGMGGPVGLRYEGVSMVMRMRRVKRSEEQDIFAKIQVMERAMLEAWSEKRDG